MLERLGGLNEDGADEERHPEHDAAVPAAPDTPNDVNATTTAASTTPTPCGVIEIMANNVATT